MIYFSSIVGNHFFDVDVVASECIEILSPKDLIEKWGIEFQVLSLWNGYDKNGNVLTHENKAS